jgi:hypothetical protein
LRTMTSLCAGCALLFVTAYSALWSAPARADITHELIGQITEIPAEGPHKETIAQPGLLVKGSGFALASGHLWVGEDEAGTPRVDEFNATTGSFEGQLSPPASISRIGAYVGYGNATSEHPESQLYVQASFVNLAVFGPSGSLEGTWTGADTPDKGFGEIFDVAVDNSKDLTDWASGYVYVASGQPSVYIFKPEAGGKETYVGSLPGPEAGGFFPLGRRTLAVDEANGDVVVGESRGNQSAVYLFEPTALAGQYALVRTLTGPQQGRAFGKINGVAIGSDGDIYVAEGGYGYEEVGVENVVDQFTAEGAYRGRMLIGNTGVDSIAVDPGTGDLYVKVPTISHSIVDIFGPTLVLPDVITEGASNVGVSSATLNGKLNPLKEGQATCQFDWGTSRALLDESQPCTSTLEGETAQSVSVPLTKLQSDTTYYYRLQATNHNGTNPGEPSQDQEFTTGGPGIEDISSTDVAATSATLDAKIDPDNLSTSYYFQYGKSESYETEVPGASIGAGKGGQEVAQHVQGLTAGTVYHYRVVALSEIGGRLQAFYSRDRTFTTQASNSSFVLPDGRQWEMVSPPQKLGALIEEDNPETLQNGGVTQASAEGDAFSYTSNAPTEEDVQGFSVSAQVFSVRGPQGWESRDLGVPHVLETDGSVGKGAEVRFFSEDLSQAVVQPFGAFVPNSSPLALAPDEASEQTAFLHTDYLNGSATDPCTSSCFHPLVSGCPPAEQKCEAGIAEHADVAPGVAFGDTGSCPPFPICGPTFLGASPDGSHVVIDAGEGPLIAGAGSLYEWSEHKPPAERLQPVGLLPLNEGGGPIAGGVILGESKEENVRHAISDDGSRVFVTGGGASDSLYMRDLLKGETLRLDVVQSGRGEGPLTTLYQDASADGSRVFFTSGRALLSGAGSNDLYECHIVEEASGALHCDLSDLATNEIGMIAGTSEDGSWVYFVAASASGPTMYVRHAGVTKPIAVLSAGSDVSDWGNGRSLYGLTVRVSPNGHWLTFLSGQELTGYDSRDAVTGNPDEEVYLYNGQSEKLVCASCDPDGARPLGESSVPSWIRYNLTNALYQPRYLSDSGRLFFNSEDALVPGDVNGAEDVYEYEPLGVPQGSVHACASDDATFGERSDGCVDLVSSGESTDPSRLMDASESGEDVFFLTNAKLASQDFDNSPDVYDAHECTGAAPCFPVAPLMPPPCDTGDACKAAPTSQPAIFGAPSSATFSGAGNVTPSVTSPTTKKPPTRAQRLANALKACRKKKGKRRTVCERTARRTYGKQARVNTKKRGGR